MASINRGDYIGKVISMDPRQLHNEICAAAENLRRQYGIREVSVNPWFYLMPPKARRDRRQTYGVHDLWKLYDSTGDDTDGDEGGGGKVARPSQSSETVPDNSSSQTESGRNNVANFDEAGRFKSSASSSSARTEASKEESNSLEIKRQMKNKKSKKKRSLPSAKILKLLEENLPAVNYAKEREEKMHSLYGNKASHIKAKEDWLKVMETNYTSTYNTPYWPCEPLNHSYAFQKFQVIH